ncbi:MAG: hypothetical protein LBT24_00015 [Tannerella sp.]|nr:hypothetical protein [Tannerella sp.]
MNGFLNKLVCSDDYFTNFAEDSMNYVDMEGIRIEKVPQYDFRMIEMIGIQSNLKG